MFETNAVLMAKHVAFKTMESRKIRTKKNVEKVRQLRYCKSHKLGHHSE